MDNVRNLNSLQQSVQNLIQQTQAQNQQYGQPQYQPQIMPVNPIPTTQIVPPVQSRSLVIRWILAAAPSRLRCCKISMKLLRISIALLKMICLTLHRVSTFLMRLAALWPIRLLQLPL